ncbi:F0F1 ATP synthase subunit delta [Allofustis seminis]|uniref:F0F1 ATP synthase subunit delta n=1 Tax=Allofustis seminis TaxID=166939 RepID=UPI00037ED9AC|nr:F0F1 ATP synthase subunit delta [Allofustis seminis]
MTRSNDRISDELIKSLPKDIAVKYLNDLQVIREVVDGLGEHFDVLRNDPAAFQQIYEELSDRVHQLVHDYEDSLIRAGLYYDVRIYSAKPLSDAMKAHVLEKVEAQWGPHYLVKYVVDQSLIGGIRLEVGEAVFDATYKSRIDQILREV